MKYNIIKTDNYLLVVDDSEIKEGDYYLSKISDDVFRRCIGCHWIENYDKKMYKKIIAHLPLNNSPIFEGVDLLPELEQEDDVKKLALNRFPKDENWTINLDNSHKRLIWVDGYNKAKEKYKYTEEDIHKALSWGYHTAKDEEKGIRSSGYGTRFIQSISQPKMPIAFECEIELYNEGGFSPEREIKKITSNGHTVWAGKYIY